MPWLQGVPGNSKACPPRRREARAKQLSFGFEPGDIVSTVMSFGSPTPVEVVVVGPERDAVRAHALKILAEMKKIPDLRDVQLYQQLDYPDGAGRHRPREGGTQRRDRQGRYRRAAGGHFFQPLRGQELLARPEDRASITRSRSKSPRSAWTGRSRSRPCPSRGQSRQQPDGPRRGQGAAPAPRRARSIAAPCSAT